MIDPYTPALEQARLVAKREVSAAELVELYLGRISEHNPALNAYWLLTPELAREQAAQPAGRDPLSGAPVSIKDLVALSGYPTTYGSRAFVDNVTDFDQFPVARIKAQGSPILVKTTTPEFGSRPVTEFGLHGIARNPWNPDHSAGGSSGGAAAAVAAGLCSWAHGTDGGGSIRIPASCCGLVGLKPSRGRVSRGPIQGEGWAGLATDGVIGRTVADAAAGLDAIAGHLPGDPYWAELPSPLLGSARGAPPRPLRIGFTTRARVTVNPEVVACVKAAARACAGAGHQVSEGGPQTQEFELPQRVIVMTGTAAWQVPDISVLDPINRNAFEHAPRVTAADYYKAVTAVRNHSRLVVAFWDDHDVLITPTLTEPAPRNGTMGADPATAHIQNLEWLSFTYPYNCTGQPAISLPLGTTRAGLPIGVQLVGPPLGESVILALAAQLEESMPWRDRRPPAFA